MSDDPQPGSPQSSVRNVLSGDDVVLPFQTLTTGVIGRVVRLGPAVDAILNRHDYPEPVAQVLGEALALTAMLGTALKYDARLILQTRTDGPLGLLVVNFDSPGSLRGYASFNSERISELESGAGLTGQGELLGHGHLAMTIDPGGDMDRYQGIVALEGQPLTEAALTYFRQSEQLPTFLRLAVARLYTSPDKAAAEDGKHDGWSWRAGGILIQHLTSQGGNLPEAVEHDDGSLALAGDDDDDWQRTRLLAETVEDHEMLDPGLAPERLLYRLFHEEDVRAGEPRDLIDQCRCSRERVAGLLAGFAADEMADLKEDDGTIAVTCEFCNTTYRFED